MIRILGSVFPKTAHKTRATGTAAKEKQLSCPRLVSEEYSGTNEYRTDAGARENSSTVSRGEYKHHTATHHPQVVQRQNPRRRGIRCQLAGKPMTRLQWVSTPEKILAAQAPGSADVSWINNSRTYRFELYGLARPSELDVRRFSRKSAILQPAVIRPGAVRESETLARIGCAPSLFNFGQNAGVHVTPSFL